MKKTRFILPLLAVLFVTLIQGQASAADSPVGSWKWFNNDSIVVKPDSTVWRDDQKLGDWEWTDKAKLEFTTIHRAGTVIHLPARCRTFSDDIDQLVNIEASALRKIDALS